MNSLLISLFFAALAAAQTTPMFMPMQNGAAWSCLTTGTATAFACAPQQPFAAYVDRQPLILQPHTPSGVNPTVDYNSLGIRKLYKAAAGSAPVQIASGDLQTIPYLFLYDASLDSGMGGFVQTGSAGFSPIRGVGGTVTTASETTIATIPMPAMVTGTVCHGVMTFFKSTTTDPWTLILRTPASAVPGSVLPAMLTSGRQEASLEFWVENRGTTAQTWWGNWQSGSTSGIPLDQGGTGKSVQRLAENYSAPWVLLVRGFSTTGAGEAIEGERFLVNCW